MSNIRLLLAIVIAALAFATVYFSAQTSFPSEDVTSPQELDSTPLISTDDSIPTDASYIKTGSSISDPTGHYTATAYYNLSPGQEGGIFPAGTMRVVVTDNFRVDRKPLLLFSEPLVYGPDYGDNAYYTSEGFTDNMDVVEWLQDGNLSVYISTAKGYCSAPLAYIPENYFPKRTLDLLSDAEWSSHTVDILPLQPLLTEPGTVFNDVLVTMAGKLDAETREWRAIWLTSESGGYSAALFYDPAGPNTGDMCGDLGATRLRIYSHKNSDWLPGFVENLSRIKPSDQVLKEIQNMRWEGDTLRYEIHELRLTKQSRGSWYEFDNNKLEAKSFTP